jgi:hypothetical protein
VHIYLDRLGAREAVAPLARRPVDQHVATLKQGVRGGA